MAGGLLVVTLSFSVSKKMLYQSRELFRSGLFLREKMFEYEVAQEIEEGSKAGSWPSEGWRWKLQASPMKESSLEKVELEVLAPGRSASAHEIFTYLGKKKK
jgi:hypothetical protein